MKTLKNILASTLASLLVFASANAGEVTISGSMEAAATQVGGDVSGNRLGLENELTVTGSTELDNGIGVAYKQTITGSMGFNDAELAFSTPYGGIAVTSTGGTIEDIDNIVPTAFEEAEALWAVDSGDWGDVGNTDGTYGIKYTNALLNTGMNLTAFYTPKATTGDGGADDAVTGASGGANNYGEGYSIVLRGNPLGMIDGVDLAVGYENLDTVSTATGDVDSATAALNYTYGPIKVGYQIGAISFDQGTTANSSATTRHYKNNYLGVAYAVNDAFSISWQESKSTRGQEKVGSGDAADKGTLSTSQQTEATSVSATYTTGGLTVAYVNTNVDDAEYTAARSKSANQIVVSVAF